MNNATLAAMSSGAHYVNRLPRRERIEKIEALMKHIMDVEILLASTSFVERQYRLQGAAQNGDIAGHIPGVVAPLGLNAQSMSTRMDLSHVMAMQLMTEETTEWLTSRLGELRLRDDTWGIGARDAQLTRRVRQIHAQQMAEREREQREDMELQARTRQTLLDPGYRRWLVISLALALQPARQEEDWRHARWYTTTDPAAAGVGKSGNAQQRARDEAGLAAKVHPGGTRGFWMEE